MSGFLILFINLLIQALFYAILGRVILSWIDPQVNWGITRVLYDMTEPVLGPIRNVLPSFGMIDFSPLVALLLLQLVGQALISVLS